MNVTAESIITLIAQLEAKEQMQAIELVTAFLCCRMKGKDAAMIMAAGFNKHIKQLIEDHYEQKK